MVNNLTTKPTHLDTILSKMALNLVDRPPFEMVIMRFQGENNVRANIGTEKP